MIYKNLTFPKLTSRPFFYSNFVSTLDGKVVVTTNPTGYWPLGSDLDRSTLYDLRTYADALIHGATTALSHRTVDGLNRQEFKKTRQKHHKAPALPYFIISGHPDEHLLIALEDAGDIPLYIVCSESVAVPPSVEQLARVVRCGKTQVDLKKFAQILHALGFKHVEMEGGPHIFGSFFAADLIDEVFMTITPKIIGNDNHQTLTMVEGHLFAPKDVKHLKLISAKPVKDEVYLRYRVIHE